MRISIIVIAHNEEKNITHCLESLESQILKPQEIIFIDDDSTDKTYRIASRFPVKLIKIKRSERSKARNIGWQKAMGNIICFAEADSVFDKYWLSEIMKTFKKGADAVIDRRKMYQPKTFFQKSLEVQFDIRYSNYKPFSAWAFKKNVLKDTGVFDEELNQSEDSDLGKRIKKLNYKIKLAKNAIQYHRGEAQNLFQYLKRSFISEKRKFRGYYKKYPQEIPKNKIIEITILFLIFILSFFNIKIFIIFICFLFFYYLAIFIKISVIEKGWKKAKKRYLIGLSFFRLARNIIVALSYFFKD